VHEDDGRSLAHPRAVGDERRPIDVEPQPRPVHIDLHSMPLPLVVSDPAQAGDITTSSGLRKFDECNACPSNPAIELKEPGCRR
jgi:hypothetical protein